MIVWQRKTENGSDTFLSRSFVNSSCRTEEDMYNQQHDNKDDELVNGPTHPAVDHPPVGLHEYSRSKVLLWVPPVGRARRAAAETQDTLVETILHGQVVCVCAKIE